MFDIDLSSKRAKLALRFFTYGVMTVATIIITTFLIFFALGYRLDRNFNFAQGGLVQFRSFPEGASITVDEAQQSFRTPGKMNLPTGQHTASMALDGYRTWSKQFDLAPGQLLWLNYARFIPTQVQTNQVREFQSVADAAASPNRRWLLVQERTDAPVFTLVDAEDEREPKFSRFTLPDAALTKKDDTFGTFQIIEWDLKSQFVLLKHQHGDTLEFIRLDRTKLTEPVNLTKVFSLNIREAHFSGNSADIIFTNTGGVLRRLDVGSTNASGALVRNLKQFVVYGEGSIAFTNLTDDEPKKQELGIWRNNQTTVVRTLPVDADMALDYSEYDDHEYLALGNKSSPRVELIRDPRDTVPSDTTSVVATYDLGAPVRWLSFSNNGRMLVAQHNNTIGSYDIEESKTYHKTLSFGTEITTPLQWLDDFYLWSDIGGSLRFVEFDGTNDHAITAVQPGHDILLSGNGQRVFSVGKNQQNGRFILQASRLTNEE